METDPEVLQDQIDALQKQIDEVTEVGPQLEAEHRKVADALVRSEGELKKVTESVARLAVQAGRVSKDLESRIARVGFGSFGVYPAAKLGEEELERWGEKVERFETSLKEAAGRRKAAAASCKGKMRPDIVALAANLANLNHEVGALDEEVATVTSQVKDRRKTLDALAKDTETSHKLDEEYRRIGHLADVTQGLNSQRVSLQRFVLASLLDDVVVRATNDSRR